MTTQPPAGHLTDGTLDLRQCPRCGDRTHWSRHFEGKNTVQSWYCDRCEGWWQQVNHRDAIWCPQSA